MYKGSKPRIVPILIAVVVIALIIAAIVSVGRMLLFGNSSSTTQPKPESESAQVKSDVLNTAEGRAVRFTERGSIVANENFKSYQISVTPTTRTYTTYKGYLDEVVNTTQYPNNTRAYEEFVYALDKAEINKLRDTQGNDDVRGVCATNGRVYLFETVNNGTATHSLWTSTCPQSKGNLGADVARIRALFVNQIPDFDVKYLAPTSSNNFTF